jgi:hypothetical protein
MFPFSALRKEETFSARKSPIRKSNRHVIQEKLGSQHFLLENRQPNQSSANCPSYFLALVDRQTRAAGYFLH